MRPAIAANAACIFRLRNHPRRFCATCATLASICNRTWIKTCCSFIPRVRPCSGLEMHLVRMHKMIEQISSRQRVIVDPVSNLQSAGNLDDSTNMLIRLIDFLRKRGITAFLVSLTSGGQIHGGDRRGMSSMVDTWLLLRDIELGGERNRLHLRFQVARHGAFQSGPGIPDHFQGS